MKWVFFYCKSCGYGIEDFVYLFKCVFFFFLIGSFVGGDVIFFVRCGVVIICLFSLDMVVYRCNLILDRYLVCFWWVVFDRY